MSESNLDKLQRIQNNFACIVTGLHRRGRITQNLGQGHEIKHSQWFLFDGKYQPL